jgi:hypothetical protein
VFGTRIFSEARETTTMPYDEYGNYNVECLGSSKDILNELSFNLEGTDELDKRVLDEMGFREGLDTELGGIFQKMDSATEMKEFMSVKHHEALGKRTEL